MFPIKEARVHHPFAPAIPVVHSVLILPVRIEGRQDDMREFDARPGTNRAMIPEHLAAFLRAAVKSVWALDLLVLIKNEPHRAWTVAALNDRLRASTSLVEEILATFTRQGLMVSEPNGTYHYQTQGETDALASELTRLYAARPLAVIKEIVSAPNEKIHSFVDAFRLKKD